VKDFGEMSDQSRVALAFVLALMVLVGWYFVNPPKPQPQPATTAAVPRPAGVAAGGAAVPVPNPSSALPTASAGGAAKAAPVVSASGEKSIVVESDLYRVELSNLGGVVRSWQLKKYTDERNPPRTLDVVNADLAKQTGAWPFSLQTSDAGLDSKVNQALYAIKVSGSDTADSNQVTLTAPAEVEFRWSDGQTEVTKRLKFDRSYIIGLETSVQQNGGPVGHQVAWRSGFGDVTAFRAALQTTAFYGRAGSITTVATKNVGAAAQRSAPAEVPGSFDAVGIQDLYFAAAFLPSEPPAGQPVPQILTLSGQQLTHQIVQDGKTTQEILPEMAVGSSAAGPLALRTYVGPKDIDILKAVRPPLNGLVNLGWTGFIAEPLFYTLRWLHRFIPNYGWAIVFMTLAINTLLYPLKLKSWRSMQKMQKVAPEVRSIQDRFKKYSMRDPRKQEMNKEVMAVYSREGINPMGSCLPTVAQLPIWWGLYRMLTVTIELRHAPWIGWIHDLSGRDPYYILPVAMAVLMYGVQKMTPMTVTDPSQARMMSLMPLMFGGMFIIFPISSGLVLYILTSNIVAMAQQSYLNRTSPLKALVKGRKKN
jgi:YidC/Oxa1 family membrane protein insertase